MKNYIILNGKLSTNISGLLIQELPSITKPKIRTQIDEIDGRDGDIVTPLGYSSYDKEFSIGLYGDFDIDEIMAYFDSKGTVIFSNEDDKYYNYQIFEQIDYERLLRFKTATIKMHIQPFKYSVNDNLKIFNIIKNFLYLPNYQKSTNGINILVRNNSINVSGIANEDIEIYIPINLSLLPNGYSLNAIANGTGVTNNSIRIINNTPNDNNSFGSTYLKLQNNNLVSLNDTLTENKEYNYLWLNVKQNEEIDYDLDITLDKTSLDGNITVKNVGNIYSKPNITIYGEGNIQIYLNNENIFQIDMNDINKIIIDTSLMEAYNDTTLLNRKVIGNYNNFKLEIGENVISWTGNITKIEIENYSRWI